MAITIQCPNTECNSKLSLPEEHAGKTVKCSACGKNINVPEGLVKLGEYRILRQIGKGGMGNVYEGEQTSLRRRVALKVLSPEFAANRQYLDRFVREARAAAAIQHPVIIQVYDIAEDNGRHFIAMDLIDGEDGYQKLKRDGALPVRQVLEIAERIASALQAAQKQSIIHRDIKPDNIMLCSDGGIKLADLGLAKNIEDDTTVTQSGAGIGTPYYIAPEQARDAANVDHRADIYALGVTLLHLVTAKRPFDGEQPWEIVEKHVKQPLPKGKDLGVELPAEVESIIQKMSAKDPAKRYQDYESLLEDIQSALAGDLEVTSAAKPSVVGKSKKRSKKSGRASKPGSLKRRPERTRKSVPVALYVGSAGVLLVIAIVAYAMMKPTEAPPKRIVRKTTHKATTSVPTTTPKTDNTQSPVGSRPTELSTVATFKEVDEYVEANPGDYERIVAMYTAIQANTTDDGTRRRAESLIRSWTRKWDKRGAEALEATRAQVQLHLDAAQFGLANEALDDMAESLMRPDVIPQMEELRTKISKARSQFVPDLRASSEKLLGMDPGNLSSADAEQLNRLFKRASHNDIGLDFRESKALQELTAKLREALDTYRVNERSRTTNRDDFWASYKSQISKTDFSGALRIAKDARGFSEDEKAILIRHTDVVRDAVQQLKDNLPTLIGKTIRFKGRNVRVKSVNDGNLSVTADGAQLTIGMDSIEPAVILSLFKSTDSLKKGLYQFHFGEEDDSIPLLNAAKAAGHDVQLYLARLNALLPEWMRDVFEVPTEPFDSYNNPVRKEIDASSGLPMEIRHKELGMHMVLAPAGRFRMGSPENEQDRNDDEGPMNDVTFTRPFYIGKYEVTDGNWERAKLARRAKYRGHNYPAIGTLRVDGLRLAGSLTRWLPRGNLRLPTEAEWEYACRAGTTTRLHYGDDLEYRRLGEYAWNRSNAGGESHPVGGKKPNQWGIYDMLGNAYELVLDDLHVYPDSPRTDPSPMSASEAILKRGGGVSSPPREMRSAHRGKATPGTRYPHQGLRLVLELPAPEVMPTGVSGSFVHLLDKTHQKNWRQSGAGNFNYKTGLAWVEGGADRETGAVVFTAKKFKNFILRYECLPGAPMRSNSGISYPLSSIDYPGGFTGDTFEIDAGRFRTGGIFHKKDQTRISSLPITDGWNDVEVLVYEKDVYVRRGNTLIIKWRAPSPSYGYLALQIFVDNFWFRKVRILELNRRPTALIKELEAEASDI